MIAIECGSEMSDIPESVKRYFLKFGDCKRLGLLSRNDKFEMVVVIPSLAEYGNVIKLLNSLAETDGKYHSKFLVLFVINNLKSDSNEIKRENAKTFELLKALIAGNRNPDNVFDNPFPDGLALGVIDAFSENSALENKNGGVGMARKIGLDFALSVLDYSVRNGKMLISLDSDCVVSKNYFTEIYIESNKRNLKAGHIRFEHPLNVFPYSEAIIKYEIYLRYYVLGLKYADSPFAFFTIGSTMFSDWEAYVKVGGMNKRKAAEDFYFMEKLAKNFEIIEIKNAVVYPSPRTSWRVPFGTGKSVSEYLRGNKRYDFLYNPRVFEILKKWNRVFYGKAKTIFAEYYLERAKKIDQGLYDFLIEQQFGKTWDKIVDKEKNFEQLNKQKKFWFDGFRTLKLIHFLRDKYYKEIDMYEALEILFKKTGILTDSLVKGKNGQLLSGYLKILKHYS